MDDNRFFVPVSLIVPGSQIPFLKNGDKDKANLDIVGQVKNVQASSSATSATPSSSTSIRSSASKQKNIQYSTGFTLAPGATTSSSSCAKTRPATWARFETDLKVPDLASPR